MPSYFTNFSTQNNGNIIKWEWDFGDDIGITSFEHPNYTFSNSGTYPVTLSATSDFGCVSSLNKNITIFELPSATFTTEITACLGNENRFIDQSICSNSNVISWEWNLGDGTVLSIQSPTHQYEFAQNFDVTLTVVSAEGCAHDTTIVNAVEVFNNPVADFNANTYSTTELTSEINFYNNSSGANSYFWNFDNSITSYELNPTIDFLDIGIYDVLFYVISANGCEDEMIKTIIIYPEYKVYTKALFEICQFLAIEGLKFKSLSS